MKEKLTSKRPYRVNFDKLFPTTNQKIWKVDLDLKEKVNDAYFAGKRVVVLIEKPKKDLEGIRITLFDHGILFDGISRKSHKQFGQRWRGIKFLD